MSHIVIHRDHSLTLDEARQAAENLAAQLAERYEFSHYWQNNTLHFERSGVSGQIALEPEKLRIDVRLGFLLVPLRSKLEREIHSYLDEMLQQTGPADLA